MRERVRAPWLGIVLLASGAGCAQSPMVLQGQVQTLQQQQTTLAQRNQELQSRASTLDQDNQELQTLLSQSQQQTRLLEDQVAVIREQLGGTTAQLAKLKQQPIEVEKKTEAWTASTKGQPGAKITTNSSLQNRLPAIRIPGVQVRADGDVVRIELPSGRLFQPGGARLSPDGTSMLDQVTAEIVRTYPDQMVMIEGHTDSDPLVPGRWQTSHQLSIGQAMAVYDQLAARSRLRPAQMVVMGYGPNHPVVSNGTAAGKERNRRVELVIYPERVAVR